MDSIFWLGVLGGIVCVIGAAWPERIGIPAYKSWKNIWFALGAVLMWLYALLGFLYQGASIFFVLLEILVLLASVCMLFSVPVRVSATLLGLGGIMLAVWSLLLANDVETFWFIAGLVSISFGYVLTPGSLGRHGALLVGSAAVAFFSALSSSWIFFWLNGFFAVCSGIYFVHTLLRRR